MDKDFGILNEVGERIIDLVLANTWFIKPTTIKAFVFSPSLVAKRRRCISTALSIEPQLNEHEECADRLSLHFLHMFFKVIHFYEKQRSINDMFSILFDLQRVL